MTKSRSADSATDLLVQVSLSFLPALDAWVEAIRRRQIRRSYGRLSDAQLRDIGLTQYELEVALSLPLERNADDALAKSAAAETAKW
jgi:uncharacterized protein YjiS (DUF1127 family)